MAADSSEDRAERLRQAADDAARVVRNLYLTFLLFGTYIAVTIGATTDAQLLKVSPVTLPLLDIGLPIVGFYAIVPWLFVLAHFNLLLQLYLLARRLHAFDAVLIDLDETARAEQLVRLFPFPFSQMLVDSHHARLARSLFTLVVWLTVLLLPLVLLLWAQVRFLPYHDITVTWIQRGALITDVLMLWVFWPLIVTPNADARAWWGRVGSCPRRWAQVFSMTIQTIVRFRTSDARRFHMRVLGRWFRARRRLRKRARGAALLAVTSIVVLPLSLLVAVVPGEGIDTAVWKAEKWAFQQVFGDDPFVGWCSLGDNRNLGTTRHLTSCLLDKPNGLFSRNLRLAEGILVAGEPPPEVIVALQEDDDTVREEALKRIVGLSLLDRDLRFIELRAAFLPKVDLRRARLNGADLSSADLQGANLAGANLQDANLSYARLQSANLRSVQLRDANLQSVRLLGAELEAAELSDARLQGADLAGAELKAANLSRARLEGANLAGARLQGANLRSVKLHGANLKGAELEGADLKDAELLGADLQGAKLHGAKLWNAALESADLEGADLVGADLRHARIASANLYSASLRLSDLRGLDMRPMGEEERAQLHKQLTASITDDELRARIIKRVERDIARPVNLKVVRDGQNVLCDDWADFPSELTCTFDVWRYDIELLIPFLTRLSCDNQHIALSLAHRALVASEEIWLMSEEPDDRPFGPGLAVELLKPDCEGGAVLPEQTKEALKEAVQLNEGGHRRRCILCP